MTKINKFLKTEDTVSYKDCLSSLKDVGGEIFTAYYEAIELYNKEIQLTPIEARGRMKSAYLNAKIIQCMISRFPKDVRYGKYRRFILRKNGYQLLFKKLDKYGKPMNIKTKLVNSINYQLFDERLVSEPFIYFGYSENSFGEIVNPKLTYIYKGEVKWIIDEANFHRNIPNNINLINEPEIKIRIKSNKDGLSNVI